MDHTYRIIVEYVDPQQGRGERTVRFADGPPFLGTNLDELREHIVSTYRIDEAPTGTTIGYAAFDPSESSHDVQFFIKDAYSAWPTN
jgi:hypothetical protein